MSRTYRATLVGIMLFALFCATLIIEGDPLRAVYLALRLMAITGLVTCFIYAAVLFVGALLKESE